MYPSSHLSIYLYSTCRNLKYRTWCDMLLIFNWHRPYHAFMADKSLSARKSSGQPSIPFPYPPYHPIPSISPYLAISRHISPYLAWSLVLNPCRPPAQRASYPPPRHIVHCHAGPGGTINTNLTRQKDAKRIEKFYKLWPQDWRSQRSAPLIHLGTEHLLHPRQVWDKAIISHLIHVHFGRSQNWQSPPHPGVRARPSMTCGCAKHNSAACGESRVTYPKPPVGVETWTSATKCKSSFLKVVYRVFSCFFGVPDFLILNSVHSIKMVKV